jgi:hypothetical protein
MTVRFSASVAICLISCRISTSEHRDCSLQGAETSGVLQLSKFFFFDTLRSIAAIAAARRGSAERRTAEDRSLVASTMVLRTFLFQPESALQGGFL